VNPSVVPFWIEALVAVLLVVSGVFAFVAAFGLLAHAGFFLTHARLRSHQHHWRLVRHVGVDPLFFRTRGTARHSRLGHHHLAFYHGARHYRPAGARGDFSASVKPAPNVPSPLGGNKPSSL
jgi:ABC-type transport system involved in cytochrome bd biosynthesis fused ATPase/permease subunit